MRDKHEECLKKTHTVELGLSYLLHWLISNNKAEEHPGRTDEVCCLRSTRRALFQTNTETIMGMDKTPAGLQDLDSTL